MPYILRRPCEVKLALLVVQATVLVLGRSSSSVTPAIVCEPKRMDI